MLNFNFTKDFPVNWKSFEFGSGKISRTPSYAGTRLVRANQPTNQPTKQETYQPANQPTSQPTNQSTNQPASQPAASQPTNQPTNQPINQSIITSLELGRTNTSLPTSKSSKSSKLSKLKIPFIAVINQISPTKQTTTSLAYWSWRKGGRKGGRKGSLLVVSNQLKIRYD